MDAINKKVKEKLSNEDDFNNAINDYVDETNVPSFLHINSHIRKNGKKQYWNILLRNQHQDVD